MVRRIAKAMVPTTIAATLLGPMATIRSPLLSSRALSTASSPRTRLHDGRICSGTPAPPPDLQANATSATARTTLEADPAIAVTCYHEHPDHQPFPTRRSSD